MPDVADDAENHRYTLTADGKLAGFIDYHDHGTTRSLIHTEVDGAFEGRGIGGRLVRGALDDARRRGLAVLPYCEFVRGYLQRHPDDVDLVPAARRAEFGLAEAGAGD